MMVISEHLGAIVPLKDSSRYLLDRLFPRLATLGLPAILVVDNSEDPENQQYVRELCDQTGCHYVYRGTTKMRSLDYGAVWLRERGCTKAISIDDDALISRTWVDRCAEILETYDLCWGFGCCNDPSLIGRCIDADLNFVVAILPQRYWLHSGIYAFNIEPFEHLGGFTRLENRLSEDMALMAAFEENGFPTTITNQLLHEVMIDMTPSSWFGQKVRWMGELLTTSRWNILLLLPLPLWCALSPLLMYRVSRVTTLKFSATTYMLMPAITVAYAAAMVTSFLSMIRHGGVRWSGVLYKS